MQEKLNLVQMPKIDLAELSNAGQFKAKIHEFQERYNIELEFNENARWRPGSYERLKDKIVKSLFVNWSKPKGANTIRKLTRINTYSINQFKDEMIQIDDELRVFRQENQSLDPNVASKSTQECHNEYFSNLLEPVEGVYVEINNVPWITRQKRQWDSIRTRGKHWEETWDKESKPEFNHLGQIISAWGLDFKSIKTLQDKYKDTTNPRRWFINISVPIKDININYYLHRHKEDILTSIPYGNLVVTFSIPIYDAIKGYSFLKHKTRKKHKYADTNQISNHTYAFPKHEGVKHPFVQNRYPDNSNNNFYGYDLGNTCFGDFKDDIVNSLYSGVLGNLKAVLNDWSSKFYVGNTTPLNQSEWHHVGLPKTWTEMVKSHIPTTKRLCENVYHQAYRTSEINSSFSIQKFKQDYLNDHCNNCQLSINQDCLTFRKLTDATPRIPTKVLQVIYELLENPESHVTPYNLGDNRVASWEMIVTRIKFMWEIVSDIDSNKTLMYNTWKVNISNGGNLRLITCSNLMQDFKCFVRKHKENQKNSKEFTVKETLAIAELSYKIYRLAERMYWMGRLQEEDVSTFENTVKLHRYSDIHEAEDKCPIADIKQLINHRRVIRNETPISSYINYLLTQIRSSDGITN